MQLIHRDQELEILTLEFQSMERRLKDTERELVHEHQDAIKAKRAVTQTEEALGARSKWKEEQWERHCTNLEAEVAALQARMLESSVQASETLDHKRQVWLSKEGMDFTTTSIRRTKQNQRWKQPPFYFILTAQFLTLALMISKRARVTSECEIMCVSFGALHELLVEHLCITESRTLSWTTGFGWWWRVGAPSEEQAPQKHFFSSRPSNPRPGACPCPIAFNNGLWDAKSDPMKTMRAGSTVRLRRCALRGCKRTLGEA